ATIIGLITGILGFLGSIIGAIAWFYNFRKTQGNSWTMLGWKKKDLKDLIKQLKQPMDVVVKPALCEWITRATNYAGDLNIEALQESTGQKCCADIEAGLKID
ncbi:hypothetical protein Ancab_004909, partial [Ancistrocladus abbreviatus]